MPADYKKTPINIQFTPSDWIRQDGLSQTTESMSSSVDRLLLD